MHQIKSDQLRKTTASDDDTEIVIVSDTVRQRRSRTPITPTDSNRESNLVMMPDLLPKKNEDESVPISIVSNQSKIQYRDKSGQKQQLVEVKERDLVPNNVGKVVNTVSILESCSKLEPQHVEMVNIIDATSDSDTATSTPTLSRKSPPHNNSIDELTTELRRELDTLTNAFDTPAKAKKISLQKLENDRDILRDSENLDKISMMKLRPSLKDLLMEERGSFYSADKENFEDEPLVFSDDEEIPRYSIEMDSDSDLVDRKLELVFACCF